MRDYYLCYPAILTNTLVPQPGLSPILQNHPLLSHIHITPTPNIQLGPTDSFYQVPPSSVDIATARNPSLFGLIDRDLGLTEMGL